MYAVYAHYPIQSLFLAHCFIKRYPPADGGRCRGEEIYSKQASFSFVLGYYGLSGSWIAFRIKNRKDILDLVAW
jgi:hypothetical protein